MVDRGNEGGKKGLSIMADTFVLAPKLRKLFFRGAENTGLSIENAVHFPTDAQIVDTLQKAGLLNMTGTLDPMDGDNAIVPAYIGQFYINTSASKAYFSKGLSAVDWIELTK
jgi:hypothetical protein